MVDARPFEVALAQLPRRDKTILYWGCYWRAVLFVLAQIAVTWPICILGWLAVDRWMGDDGRGFVIVFVVTEACSFVLGFCFVAMYVRFILGRPIGRVRFALISESLRVNPIVPGPSPGSGGAA